MSVPGVNRLLVRPAWALNPSNSPISDGYNRPYIPPIADNPNSAFNAPGLDLPFLYHAGSAACIFAGGPFGGGNYPQLSADTAWDGGQGFYQPSSSRPWGVPGFMVRIPRCVVILTWAFSSLTTAGITSQLSSALNAAGAALVCGRAGPSLTGVPGTNGFDFNNSYLTLGLPPSISRTLTNTFGPVFATSTGIGAISPTNWMGGEVLFIVHGSNPYFGHACVLQMDSAANTAITGAGYQTTDFGFVSQVGLDEYGVIDQSLIPVAIMSAGSVYPRCSRFSGLFLYDPSPGGSPGYITSWSQFQGFYTSDQCWADATSTLPAWNRQSVAGAGNLTTPSAGWNAVVPNITAAIASFWPN